MSKNKQKKNNKEQDEEKDAIENEVAAENNEIKINDILNENLTKAQKDVSEFKDKYYRALAEMENSRKRLQTEKHE